ncbi:MAG: RNA methyltransferase [Chloroflexota bacterium]|nr:MAG: RNA methyltransferase [Chloroflexota bacterium]
MVDQISSFSNPLIKRVKRLRQKKYRRQDGLYFVEGLRVVLSAVEANAPIETIIYCPALLTSDVAWNMLRRREQLGTRLQAVSAPVFASISGRDNPVGLGAIVRAQWTDLADLTAGADDIFVALFEAAEPGNLGTIMRTMDAIGARGVILVGDSVDPFHPSAVKASMGALFSLSLSQIADSEALFSWAESSDLLTVASSASGATPSDEANYQLPVLLLLGNEGAGLPASVTAASEFTVAISMAGAASSLNLAVAAGLLLYEIRRSSAA